jgi:hypothetical protein
MVIKIRKVLQEKVIGVTVLTFFSHFNSHYLHKFIVGAISSRHVLKWKICMAIPFVKFPPPHIMTKVIIILNDWLTWAVIFFTNVNTNKADLSQQMDYKVWSHGLGNHQCSCYYIKKALQFVRLVINVGVKKGYIQFLETKCTSYSRNEIHGRKHVMCVVFCMPSWRC